MRELDALKEEILATYPRLGADDTLTFACHGGLGCFNTCCADVNIFLTPYDVLRLKRRLQIGSTELLTRYTIRPFTKDQPLPVVVLRMDEEREGKPCPFVTPRGCSIYEDRPWPCRMYPVGVASGRTESDPQGTEFYFLMKEQPCEGHEQARSLTIRQWMEEQGVAPYDEMGELFKEINLHPFLRKGGVLKPPQMEMYYTVCYDLDRFRSFVFESRFLQEYEVEPGEVQKLQEDDEALLRFGFRWLRTCLFFEDTIKLRPATVEKYRTRLKEQGKIRS